MIVIVKESARARRNESKAAAFRQPLRPVSRTRADSLPFDASPQHISSLGYGNG